MSVEPEELLGHGEVLAGLWRAARAERLPHGLLLRGPEGVGKFRAAQRLFQGLVCVDGPGAPCGRCGPCKRALSGNHPDLFVVDVAAEGKATITVDRITPRPLRPKDRSRESESAEDEDAEDVGGPAEAPRTGDAPLPISKFLALHAFEGGWRAVIVREAERMNPSAQNAFLKMLEEPRGRTLILLETALPGRLLPTVRSRLVPVELGALGEADCVRVLAAHGIEARAAERLARLAGGSPGRALVLERRGALELHALLVRVLAGREAPETAQGSLWRLPGEFEAATEAAGKRLRVALALDLALDLLRDLHHARAVPGWHGREPELRADPDLAGAAPGPALRWRIEALWRARGELALNLTPEAVLHRALVELARGGAAGAAAGRGRAGLRRAAR